MANIKTWQNGPYLVEGDDVTVLDWNGNAYQIPGQPFALCRCGGSEAVLRRHAFNGLQAGGWFSDIECAAPRVAKGMIGPNNPDCVKRCLDKGITPVFVSEQARAFFAVKDYPSIKDDLGFHVEVTGVVDETAQTISVRSVKRLAGVGALCRLPARPNRKQ
jgi:hypothetical protein